MSSLRVRNNNIMDNLLNLDVKQMVIKDLSSKEAL